MPRGSAINSFLGIRFPTGTAVGILRENLFLPMEPKMQARRLLAGMNKDSPPHMVLSMSDHFVRCEGRLFPEKPQREFFCLIVFPAPIHLFSLENRPPHKRSNVFGHHAIGFYFHLGNTRLAIFPLGGTKIDIGRNSTGRPTPHPRWQFLKHGRPLAIFINAS